MPDKEYKLGINFDGLDEGSRDVSKLSEEFRELEERVTAGVEAIAQLGQRTGDAKLKELADGMRAAFKEGIADAGEESIEVLRAMDIELGEMIVEFAELKKAQDEEREAAEQLNRVLFEQAKGMADAAEAAGNARKEAQEAISEWQQNAGVQGDDIRRWTEHVKEADRAGRRASKGDGGLNSVLDTMDELPGKAGAAANGIRTALGGGFWGAMVVGTTLYFKALSALADKLADMKRAAGLALPTLERFTDETKEAAKAQEDMNEALSVGANNSDNYKAALDRNAQGEQSLIDAKTENAKAAIDLQVASGELSPDEAAAQKAGLDIAASSQKRQVARQSLAGQVEEQRRVVGLLEDQAQGFFAPIQSAQTAVDVARNSPVQQIAPEEFAARKAAADKLAQAPLNTEARQEAKKELEEAQAALNQARQEAINEAVAQRDAIIAQRDEAVNRLNQGRGTLTGLETRLREFDGVGQQIFDINQSSAAQQLQAGVTSAEREAAQKAAEEAAAAAAEAEDESGSLTFGQRLGALADQVDDGRGTGTVPGASAVALRANAAALADGATAKDLREARVTLKKMFGAFFELRDEITELAQELRDIEGQANNARGASANRGGSR